MSTPIAGVSPTADDGRIAESEGSAPSVVARGRRYHRLARGSGRPWWTSVAAALLALLAGSLLLEAAATVGDWVPADGFPVLRAQTTTALLFVALGLMVPVVMGITRWVEGRGDGTLLSVEGRVRWLWVAICVGLALMYFTATSVRDVRRVAGGQWVGWAEFSGPFAALAIAVVISVVGEELVFRGVLLQAVGRIVPNAWPAILVQAVAWMGAHYPTEFWGAFELVAVGIALGWLTVWTGGPEIAIAWHIGHNIGVTIVVIALFGADQPPSGGTMGDMAAEAVLTSLMTSAPILLLLVAVAIGFRPRAVRAAGHQAE